MGRMGFGRRCNKNDLYYADGPYRNKPTHSTMTTPPTTSTIKRDFADEMNSQYIRHLCGDDSVIPPPPVLFRARGGRFICPDDHQAVMNINTEERSKAIKKNQLKELKEKWAIKMQRVHE